MDVTKPPPRSWINETLVFDQPEKIDGILALALQGMKPSPESLADLPRIWLCDENPNAVLASRILDGAPFCFYGENILNRYAHGAWALVILGRDNAAWEVVEKIPPVATRTRFPKGTLRMATYLALRCNRASDAMKCWLALAKWHRGSLTDEDYALRDTCLWQLQDMVTPR